MANDNDTITGKASRHAEPDTVTVEAVEVGNELTVPVMVMSPEQGIPRSVALSATNPVSLLLSQDPDRRKAVIVADGNVVIAGSKEEAQFANANAATASIQGFYLPKNVALNVESTGVAWVTYTTTDAPTGGAVTHVSVWVERYENA